jgi:RimJ/RimL family protein N-acetyltransferase
LTFSVRPATIQDLNTLVSFTLTEAVEAEGVNFSEQTVRRGISAALQAPAIACYWVMENHDGVVVGSISVVREWSDWRAGYYWWIQSMFIRSDYRGQGLMRQLIATVVDAAANENALELRLYVHEDNHRAMRAYRRADFIDSPYRIMTMKKL